MKYLSNKSLIEAYYKAKELQLSTRFIALLASEISYRSLKNITIER